MKKLTILLILLALITPVFAQENTNRREGVYYVNVPVERIIPVADGYLIQYRSASNLVVTTGVPVEWFYESGGRAELIRLPDGGDWPTMSVFYVNGEFSHVRLYVHRAKSHRTWGNISQGTDVSRYFQNRETFSIQY